MHESEKGKWSHSVVSDSSRPHGLQPTRLLCPWDFPDKSTGVGCHCLLLLVFLHMTKWSPRYSSYHLSPFKYCLIIDYIFHTEHFMPVTNLFCNWSFVLLNLPHLFFSFSHHPSLSQPPVCSLYLWLCFCFVMAVSLFCSLDSTYKWNHTVFIFLCLNYFTNHNNL